MFYWLVGAVNPLLAFAVVRKMGKLWPTLIILCGFGYVSYFGHWQAKSSAAKPTRISKFSRNSQTESATSFQSIFQRFLSSLSSDSSLGIKDEELSNSFRACLRLRGLSGQVEDKTLLFFNFRSLTFWLIAPFFWLVELVCPFRYKRFICETVAYLATIIILPFDLSGLGMARTLCWYGPFYWLRFHFGIYGRRALILNCALFSLVFPEVFGNESTIVMLSILFAMGSILNEHSSLRGFIAGNLMISLMIGLAVNKLELIDILMSPAIEILAYVVNLSKFFHLSYLEFFQNIGIFNVVCVEPSVRLSFSIPNYITETIFQIFLSYLLLDYLNQYDQRSVQ